MASLAVLVWNIQSQDLSSNALEFVPGQGALSDAGQRTMQQLLDKARELMVNHETTRTLEDLLGDGPIRKTTPLEKDEIRDERSLRGLERWLESRRPACEAIWPGFETHRLVERWAKEPEVRWEFWRRQTVRAWLCDDGSGGKVNPLLPPNSPTIDEECWGLGLSSADKRYGGHPQRVQRARWLRASTASEAAELPATGKYDFFKLLVWDMLVGNIIDEAAEGSATSALLMECRLLGPDERMRKIKARIQEADIAVLLEVPKDGAPGLDDKYWCVSCSRDESKDNSDNTFILAKRSLFAEPLAFDLKDGHGDGQVNPRVAGCDLEWAQSESIASHGPLNLRVIGVHLSSNGLDKGGIVPAVEAKLNARCLLAGDFNVDLRTMLPPWISETSTPRLLSLVGQAKQTPLRLGTTNKMRSPFQAQVAKILVPEFVMKDFAFVGESIRCGAIDGPVPKSITLPSADIPSDHAPLTFKISFEEGSRGRLVYPASFARRCWPPCGGE